MKVSFLSILVLTLLFGFGSVMFGVDKPSGENMFKGYLSDAACGTSATGKAADGTDMVKSPENHTVACMKADACVASGFGMMIKGKDKKYSFVKFDSVGSDQAKSILMSTKKTKGIKLQVEGEMKDNMITVKSLKEVAWTDGKKKMK